MTIGLRPIDPRTDFPRLAELLSLVETEQITADMLREWEDRRPEGLIRRQMAAVAGGGQIAGISATQRPPWAPEGRFYMTVVVDPASRGRGVGTALYDDARGFAEEQGAASISSAIRDNSPESLRFAERRGFTIDRHVFESTLDLASFDEGRFAGVLETVQAPGIRLFTLADAGETEEAKRRLYEVNRRVAIDIPGSDGVFLPFEEFQKQVFEASWYRPDGQILAAAGDTYVGLAAVGHFRDTNSMNNMITGVLPEYRGRTIALALKLLAIRFARAAGAAYLRTNNDSQNAPILAINRKLGYQPQPGWYRLKREREGTE